VLFGIRHLVTTDFTVIADYWKISLEEGISSLGVQFTLDDCYIAGNDAACALITRKR